MFALRIHFTDVNFPESGPCRTATSWSLRLSWGSLAARNQYQNRRKPEVELGRALAGGQPSGQWVSVGPYFQGKEDFQNSPSQRLIHRVGMYNNRPPTPHHFMQGADSNRFEVSIQVAWSMERNSKCRKSSSSSASTSQLKAPVEKPISLIREHSIFSGDRSQLTVFEKEKIESVFKKLTDLPHWTDLIDGRYTRWA